MTRRALSVSRSHHRLENKCSKQVTPHMPVGLAAKVESNTAKREKARRDAQRLKNSVGNHGTRGFGTSGPEPIRDGNTWDRFPAGAGATHLAANRYMRRYM